MNSDNHVNNGSAEREQIAGSLVTAYLSLGSNVGDKQKILDSAIEAIGERPGIILKNRSSYYITEPIDGGNGDNFLNCAVEIETMLEPLDLLDAIEDIEVLHGRTAKATNKPRTLDIDIILYGGMVVAFPRLKVPHPRMAERMFVLEPLGQIAPELRHPTLNMTSAELARAIPGQAPLCKRLDSI